ncbi:glycosyltransferase [Candidatus Woesearchaeota archaeon]|nr:glycosyltransferase [Candidatus Woesearchaeota archaeon]
MRIKCFTPSNFVTGGVAQCSHSIKLSLDKRGKKIRIEPNDQFDTSNPFYFIKKALRSSNCDVLLVQYNADLFGNLFGVNGVYAFIFYFLVKLANVKIATTIHDIPALNKYTKFQQKVLRLLFFPVLFYSDKITVHTNEARSLILEYGCKKDKLVKVEHGINVAGIKIQNKNVAKKKIRKKNKKIIFAWGFIRPSKGYEKVIAVMPKLSKEIVFIIAGPVYNRNKKNRASVDLKYCNYLKALTRRLKLNKRIFIEDRRLTDKEIELYMSAADISILPYKFITQSGVLSRSFAYKRIILASNVPPFPSIKKDYGSIETYKLNDEEDLINKIKLLLYNKRRIKNLNKKVEQIRKIRDWDNISIQLWDLFENIYKL